MLIERTHCICEPKGNSKNISILEKNSGNYADNIFSKLRIIIKILHFEIELKEVSGSA